MVLLLLYCMLMLRVVQLCRMLLLLLLLLPNIRLVGGLLTVVWGRGVVLIRRLPVDGQIGHDELISGTFCAVIRRHVVRLRVLLAGLVPGEERREVRERWKKTNYLWCSMVCVCVCEQVGEAHAQRHSTYKHTCTIHCMSMYVDRMFLFFILGI